MNITAISYYILRFILFSRLIPYIDGKTGDNRVNFNAIYQLLVSYSVFVRRWSRLEYNGAMGPLLIRVDFQKAYDKVRRKVVYKILIDFSTHMKIFAATKIHLRGSYWLEVHKINIYLLNFLLQGSVKKYLIVIAFQICFRMSHFGGSRKPGGSEI
jgi:hypothetical protein